MPSVSRYKTSKVPSDTRCPFHKTLSLRPSPLETEGAARKSRSLRIARHAVTPSCLSTLYLFVVTSSHGGIYRDFPAADITLPIVIVPHSDHSVVRVKPHYALAIVRLYSLQYDVSYLTAKSIRASILRLQASKSRIDNGYYLWAY